MVINARPDVEHLQADLMQWRPLCGLLIACCLSLMTGCQKAKETPDVTQNTVDAVSQPKIERPPSPSLSYIGSARCADCHQDIAQRYARHPMAHSAGRTEDYAAQEQRENARFSSGPYEYQVLSTEQGIVHREACRAEDRSLLYEELVPMPYAIGSGQRGRAYLAERDGLLFESPITWYSSDRRWDLSPGYEKHNQHFGRQVGDGCIYCHIGQPNPVADDTDRYLSPLFIEAGISCERCHGPGQDHVAFHASQANSAADERLSKQPDPIVNPRDLPPEQREAVCNQCHLQGDERILRYGRRNGDFRPGDNLHDIWISFTSGTKVIDGVSTEAVSQVEQMRASKCFTASEGRFGCTSCHDPHGIPEVSMQATYYRGRCLTCHGEEKVACSETETARTAVSDNCVTCHLPQLATSDVPHTSQTDHRVRRRPQVSSKPVAGAESTFQIFGSAERDVPSWEIERARGLLMVNYAEREHDRRLAAESLLLLEPLASRLTDDAPLLSRLGVAYNLANQPDRARLAWEAAIQADPRAIEPRRRLALILFDELHPATALEPLEAAYALNPWDEAICGRLILARAAQGQIASALELAQTAVAKFPDSIQLHRWLAGAYQRRGEIAESRRHLEQAERLENSQPAQ